MCINVTPSFDCDKVNMRLWVAGLRSGEFTQGRQALKKRQFGGTYVHCCLGVACEVAMRNGVVLEQIFPPENTEYEGVKFEDGGTSTLPTKVSQWLGLASGDPLVTPGCGAVYLNDGKCWSFGQIADALWETYKLGEEDDQDTA